MYYKILIERIKSYPISFINLKKNTENFNKDGNKSSFIYYLFLINGNGNYC